MPHAGCCWRSPRIRYIIPAEDPVKWSKTPSWEHGSSRISRDTWFANVAGVPGTLAHPRQHKRRRQWRQVDIWHERSNRAYQLKLLSFCLKDKERKPQQSSIRLDEQARNWSGWITENTNWWPLGLV